MVLVGHVPIRKNDDTRRKPFPFPSLFGATNIEINVIPVFQFLVKGTLKPVGPLRVELNNLLEVVEKLAIGVHASDLHIGSCMPDELALKEWD
jgi:hypothetical protein